MNKFLNYRQFNEGIEDIFRSAHAAIDRKDLQPLKKFIGKPKFPTQEEVDAAVEFLKIDPDYLFYNKGDMLNPIVYWKGPFFYGFFGGQMSMEVLKMTRADAYFEQKTKFVDDMLKKGDYESLFHRVDKKILIPTFIEMYDEIPDSQKYDIFIELYMRSEFGFGMFPKALLDDCFKRRTGSSEWKKRMQEFKKKAKLNPDGTLTVFRGEGTKSTKEALSWTLDKKTAKFFAERFGAHGKILNKDIDPSLVLDFLSGRGESEVLIASSSLKEHLNEGSEDSEDVIELKKKCEELESVVKKWADSHKDKIEDVDSVSRAMWWIKEIEQGKKDVLYQERPLQPTKGCIIYGLFYSNQGLKQVLFNVQVQTAEKIEARDISHNIRINVNLGHDGEKLVVSVSTGYDQTKSLEKSLKDYINENFDPTYLYKGHTINEYFHRIRGKIVGKDYGV